VIIHTALWKSPEKCQTVLKVFHFSWETLIPWLTATGSYLSFYDIPLHSPVLLMAPNSKNKFVTTTWWQQRQAYFLSGYTTERQYWLNSSCWVSVQWRNLLTQYWNLDFHEGRTFFFFNSSAPEEKWFLCIIIIIIINLLVFYKALDGGILSSLTWHENEIPCSYTKSKRAGLSSKLTGIPSWFRNVE
jgi:hypothetical protein